MEATHVQRSASGQIFVNSVRRCIGTFALVFAGCGAIAVDHLTGGAVGHLGICMTFGLVVCVMIYATGHISGAHFNPAVSLGFASAGRFSWREVPAYICSQAMAAVTAIALLGFATGTNVVGETLPTGTLAQALVIETVLTFFLMFVISAVATDHRAVGQLAGCGHRRHCFLVCPVWWTPHRGIHESCTDIGSRPFWDRD